jgi:hypothetical protein
VAIAIYEDSSIKIRSKLVQIQVDLTRGVGAIDDGD